MKRWMTRYMTRKSIAPDGGPIGKGYCDASKEVRERLSRCRLPGTVDNRDSTLHAGNWVTD